MLWTKKPASPVCGAAARSWMALCEKEIDISLVKSKLLLFPGTLPADVLTRASTLPFKED